MTQSTGVAQMNGMFKEVYGNKVARAVPHSHLLSKALPFVPRNQREGDTYNIPVLLTREHGHTFNTDGSAFDLQGAFSDQSQKATVSGVEHVLQCQLSYGAIFKATQKGDRAFVNATRHKVKAALEAASFMREYQLLWGGGSAIDPSAGDPQGLGEISAVTGSGSGSGTMTITAKSWALGLWAGLEGCPLDVYTAAGSLQSGFASESLIVDSINPDTRTITWSSSGGGNLSLAPTDYVYFRGAATKEMNGAARVANTTSGTINGISATTYQLWQGSSFNVSGALTFTKAMDGLRRPAALGFSGNMDLYVSTAAWQDLSADQAGQRRFVNKDGGKLSAGANELCYYGQTGTVRIRPHVFMKQGFALALPQGKDKCYRTGATDITFELPDNRGEFFRQLDTKAGIELRTYQLQSYFTPCPAYTVLYTDISSTGDY